MTIQNPVCDKLRNIFWYSMLNEQLRSFIGFRGISQFFEEGQGWYFWLSHKQGVYELELLNYEQKDNYFKTMFLIRYFPCLEEKLFESFSLLEQMLRLNYNFKDGCPDSASRKNLGDYNFYIGHLDIIWHDQVAFFSLRSQDNWVEYREKELVIATPAGDKKCLIEKGGTDKNIPGWSLSWDYLDCLVRAVCSVMGTPPSLVTIKNTPGKIGYINAQESIAYKLDEFILGRELTIVILLQEPQIADKHSFFDSLIPKWERDYFQDSTILFAKNREGFNDPEGCRFISPSWWEASNKGGKVLPKDLCI